MEEDIKILEEFIEAYKIAEEVLDGDVIHAIEGLIAGYKKIKENNIELQKYMKDYLIPKSTINLVYIPKSKVKEKIEELNLKLAEDVNGKIDATYNIRFTIQVLEELLVLED